MKYLKKFENHASYEEARQNLILPNVSLCAQENEVHYNPYVEPSYESVDLGLPSGTLWAKYNVGATSETEYGNYYQYGKGAAQYAATSGDSLYSGTEIPLAASADTAAQEWGGDWHMPTSGQCKELIDNTTNERVVNFNGSGINGCKFIAKNGSGNYIFIPFAGKFYDGNNSSVRTEAYCLTCYKHNRLVYSLVIDSSGIYVINGTAERGFSVRPVLG